MQCKNYSLSRTDNLFNFLWFFLLILCKNQNTTVLWLEFEHKYKTRLTLLTNSIQTIHPNVIGRASQSKNFLRPYFWDKLPAGSAPISAPITYIDMIHDSCSGVHWTRPLFGQYRLAVGVHAPITVPHESDINEAKTKLINSISKSI